MKCLVIIPTYNERENIKKLAGEVLAANETLSILIVDDNSPDGTGVLADQLAEQHPRISVMHRPAKLGLGTAYIAGFRYALQNGYDLVLEMDADFSHDPGYLKDLLAAAKEADVVIGSRYIQGVNVVNWSMHRLLLSYGANMYARLVTGMPVRDLTAGFKCFRREVLETLDLDSVLSEGYAFQIEMNFRSYKKGFKIKEIPIIFKDRLAGKTKMSKKVIWEAIWIVWKLRLLELFSKV
jgi:dolichol-phosphate mannosyltransferase